YFFKNFYLFVITKLWNRNIHFSLFRRILYSLTIINPNFVCIKKKSMSVNKEIRRITTHILQEMKQRKEKIAMLTAYDYSMATILDDAGLDVLLVGDSASNVMAGHETTLPIT